MSFHKSCLLQTLKKKQDELFNTDITEFTGKHWLSPDGRISEEASYHGKQLQTHGIEVNERKYMKDTGVVRIIADTKYGGLNVENHTKLTEKQIRQIVKFIKTHRFRLADHFAHDNYAKDDYGSDEIVKRVGYLADDYMGYNILPPINYNTGRMTIFKR
jgi:hypothetical protein